MATSNWNDIPDDVLGIEPRRVNANGPARLNRRNSPSPHLGLQPPSSGPGNQLNGLASQPPRRKTSHPGRAPAARKPLAEKYIPHASEAGGIFQINYLGQKGEETLHPLQDVANRVGREVEQFAEQVDQWKHRRQTANSANTAASALELIRQYKNIASETVERLRKTHKGQLRKRMHSSLARQILPSSRAAPAPLLTEEEEEEEEGEEGEEDDEQMLASDSSTTIRDLIHWQDEHNTWTLYEALLESRSLATFEDRADLFGSVQSILSGQDQFAADGSNWSDFIQKDQSAREHLVVLKWLQTSSEQTGEDCEMIQDRFEAASGRASGLWVHGWLETRERLKQEKRLRMWDMPIDGPIGQMPEIKSSRDATKFLVTQLDPDAVVRQQRGIEPQDEHLEHASWALLWEMLRRGKSMDEIRRWCHEQYAYGNLYMLGATSATPKGVTDATNTQSRLAWRMACLQAARHGGVNDYERAVLGLLGGDYSAVAHVCHSWEDHLFASINQILVHQYQDYLITREPQLDTIISGYAAIPDDGVTASLKSASAILVRLKNLQRLEKSKLTFEKEPLKLMQSGLIFNDIREVAIEAGRRIAQQALNKQSSHLGDLVPNELRSIVTSISAKDGSKDVLDFGALRVLVHILIIESTLGFTVDSVTDAAACDLVIIAWVNFLTQAGKLSIIPSYVGLLPSPKRELVMARVMPYITHDGQRADFLRLIEAAGINVLEVLVLQHEAALANSSYWVDMEGTIVKKPLLEATSEANWPRVRIRHEKADSVTNEEESLIQGLEWFKYVDKHWMHSFQFTKNLAFRFLAKGRTTAADELAKRIPPAALSEIKTAQIFGVSGDVMELDKDLMPPELEACKAQAQGYYDVASLMETVSICWSWRTIEDRIEQANKGNRVIRPSTQTIDDTLASLWTSVCFALEDEAFLQCAVAPLAGQRQDTWTTEAELLEVVRAMYLPDLALAYNSAAYYANRREALAHIREVAELVALRPTLQQAFLRSGRMGELVEALGLSSARLLELEEQGRGGKKSPMRRRSISTAQWGAKA